LSPGTLVLGAPWIVTLALLALPWPESRIAGDASAIDGRIYIVLLLATVVTSLYRRREEPRIGLGAMVAPLAIAFGDPLTAVTLAALGFGLAELFRRSDRGRKFRTGRARGLRDVLRGSGRVALSVLAAALLWIYAADRGELLTRALVAGLGYFIVTAAHDSFALRSGELVMSTRRRLSHYGVELAAWASGALLVYVILRMGWGVGLGLLAVMAALSHEVARQAGLRSRAEYRLRQLQTVTEASRRMVSQDLRPAGIADRVLAECRRVIDFEWLHFELLAGDDAPVSWYVEGHGELRRGVPEPDPHPKARPGFHRRQSWRVLESLLEADDTPLGRLTLWCNPRHLDDRTAELFEALCFQLTDSIQRGVLHQQANRDPLTGLGDRRVLEKRLEQLYAMCKVEGLPMAVVMFDIDHFKQINDTYGHDAGDLALVEIGQLLASHGRERDLCCRYGGEEFTLLLEATHGRKGLFIADRIRQVVESHTFEYEGQEIALRLSAGVASFPELYVSSGQELVLLADAALYESKRRGRNRSLLNLGDKRFLTAAGRPLGAPRKPKPAPAPRLFS